MTSAFQQLTDINLAQDVSMRLITKRPRDPSSPLIVGIVGQRGLTRVASQRGDGLREIPGKSKRDLVANTISSKRLAP
jgi:hypothetical protein